MKRENRPYVSRSFKTGGTVSKRVRDYWGSEKVIKKVKRSIFKNPFINLEKEENWLNNMCKDGYALEDIVNGYYIFEPCEPDTYIYRIEFLKQETFQKEKDSYLELMQELKVEAVASFRRWHYFKRDSSVGTFEIYSDIDSQIEHYQRINIIWY